MNCCELIRRRGAGTPLVGVGVGIRANPDMRPLTAELPCTGVRDGLGDLSRRQPKHARIGLAPQPRLFDLLDPHILATQVAGRARIAPENLLESRVALNEIRTPVAETAG